MVPNTDPDLGCRRWVPTTEVMPELMRLGPDPTGFATELRETLPDSTDDLPWW